VTPLLGVEAFPFRSQSGFLRICTVIVACFFLLNCGNNTCQISTSISPKTATADHAASPPGNQAQFSLSGKESGFCPQTPDTRGSWSTSDPVNTSIQAAQSDSNIGIATCINATQNPVTISNSGRIRGQGFPSATLTCH
jgi:hypothetical protein